MNKKTIIKTLIITGVIVVLGVTAVFANGNKGGGSQFPLSIQEPQEK